MSAAPLRAPPASPELTRRRRRLPLLGPVRASEPEPPPPADDAALRALAALDLDALPLLYAEDIGPECELYLIGDDDEPAEPPPLLTRPTTRGECAGGARPCPFVSCRYHLLPERKGVSGLDAEAAAELVLSMASTCALDVAAAGPTTLDEVGRLLGVTRERIRQIEASAWPKLRRYGPTVEFLRRSPKSTNDMRGTSKAEQRRGKW